MNLDRLTLEELKQLDRDLTKAISTHEARTKAAALAAVQEVAQAHGFKLADLLDAATTTARTKPAAPAKYRDPLSGKEWSGRGRQPGWIKDALAAGRPMDDFAI